MAFLHDICQEMMLAYHGIASELHPHTLYTLYKYTYREQIGVKQVQPLPGQPSFSMAQSRFLLTMLEDSGL